MEQPRHGIEVQHLRCPFCRDAVLPRDEKVACGACMGWTHSACLAEGGGRCAACGGDVASSPVSGARSPLVERWRRLGTRWDGARPVAVRGGAERRLAAILLPWAGSWPGWPRPSWSWRSARWC